jgi:hypothetical protein
MQDLDGRGFECLLSKMVVHVITRTRRLESITMKETWSWERDGREWRTLDLFGLSPPGIAWKGTADRNCHALEVRDTWQACIHTLAHTQLCLCTKKKN